MTRIMLAAVAVGTLAGGGALRAQEQPPVQAPQTQAYEQKRAELQRELEEAQARLAELRSQRVTLTARIENVIASLAQQRAQALLMSNEQTALQQLDAILTSAQDNLLAQRDRFASLGDVIRQRGGAVLVVLLRADSSGTPQTLNDAALTVDGAQVANRTYTVTSNNALQAGAVDPLYRANVLPTAHTIAVTTTVNGTPVTSSVQVTAPGASVTYVQFAIRNGQVVHTTWTSRGTTPF
jgi:hypothetical protein